MTDLRPLAPIPAPFAVSILDPPAVDAALARHAAAAEALAARAVHNTPADTLLLGLLAEPGGPGALLLGYLRIDAAPDAPVAACAVERSAGCAALAVLGVDIPDGAFEAIDAVGALPLCVATADGVGLAGVPLPYAPVTAAALAPVAVREPGATFGGVTLQRAGVDRVLLAAQPDPATNGLYVWHGPAAPLARVVAE